MFVTFGKCVFSTISNQHILLPCSSLNCSHPTHTSVTKAGTNGLSPRLWVMCDSRCTWWTIIMCWLKHKINNWAWKQLKNKIMGNCKLRNIYKWNTGTMHKQIIFWAFEVSSPLSLTLAFVILFLPSPKIRIFVISPISSFSTLGLPVLHTWRLYVTQTVH